MNNIIFWYVIACNFVQVYRRFSGKYYFHLQGRRFKHINNQVDTSSKQSPAFCLFRADFLFVLLFDPEDGGDIFLGNVG
jgi:hypothetical protein